MFSFNCVSAAGKIKETLSNLSERLPGNVSNSASSNSSAKTSPKTATSSDKKTAVATALSRYGHPLLFPAVFLPFLQCRLGTLCQAK